MAGDRHGFAGYCYDRMPDGPLHCLLPNLAHTGDHYNWPTRSSWPKTAADPTKPLPGAGRPTT
jgi:hypothetical protein